MNFNHLCSGAQTFWGTGAQVKKGHFLEKLAALVVWGLLQAHLV